MSAVSRLSDDPRASVLAKMWWPFVLRGVAAIAFAAVAGLVLGKETALHSLAFAFAVYALFDGAASIIAAMRGGGLAARSLLGLVGATSLIAGCAAFWPDITWASFAGLVGAWAVVRGVLEFASALQLRKYMERDWSLALIGGLSVLIGVGAILRANSIVPGNFVELFAIYALVLGALLAVLGYRFLKGFRP